AVAGQVCGVWVLDGAAGNVIGGSAAVPGPGFAAGAARSSNVISGGMFGVVLSGGASQNAVRGNLIGTDVTGLHALGNSAVGVLLCLGASGNDVCGPTFNGFGNVISASTIGVDLANAGTTNNRVLGNLIGTDVTGAAALSGQTFGVLLNDGASGNLIGGEVGLSGNVISGNSMAGVWMQDAGTSFNAVLGNLIGTDAGGRDALGGQANGVVLLAGASNNSIGAASASMGNVLSGNSAAGVAIENGNTTGNQVQGNLIGTDAF